MQPLAVGSALSPSAHRHKALEKVCELVTEIPAHIPVPLCLSLCIWNMGLLPLRRLAPYVVWQRAIHPRLLTGCDYD